MGLKLQCTSVDLVAPKHVQIISVDMYEGLWYCIMQSLCSLSQFLLKHPRRLYTGYNTWERS